MLCIRHSVFCLLHRHKEDMLALAFFLLPLHSALSLSLHEKLLAMCIPMEMKAGEQSTEVDQLIGQGESDRTTVVTFTVKAYITPEVASIYPNDQFANATTSIESLQDILNDQYKRSEIPIRMKIHCIEETKTSEAQGMNTLAAFLKYKSSGEKLRGSADAAALFIIGSNASSDYAKAALANPPNGDTMISVSEIQGSHQSGVPLGHVLGHNFGANHSDGYRLPGTNIVSLMNSTVETSNIGFYSNPDVKIDGIPTGDKDHNVAGLIRRHR